MATEAGPGRPTTERATPREILFVRHGQTVWNAEQRLQGRGDSPLTELGREQVRAHLTWLPALAPDHLLCSPLGRARATAKVLADALGLSVAFDDALCERCMGEFEGWTTAQIAAARAEEYGERNADPWHWRPPSGENYDDMIERTAPLLDRLLGLPFRCLLVVSHGTLMRVMLGQLLALDRGTIMRMLAPNEVPYRLTLANPRDPRVSHYRDGRWHDGVLLRED